MPSRSAPSPSQVTSSPIPVTTVLLMRSSWSSRSRAASLSSRADGARARCSPSRTMIRPPTTTWSTSARGRGVDDLGRLGCRPCGPSRSGPRRSRPALRRRSARRPPSRDCGSRPRSRPDQLLRGEPAALGRLTSRSCISSPRSLLERVDHRVLVASPGRAGCRHRPARRAGPMPSARSRSVVGQKQTVVRLAPSQRCRRR